MAIANDAGLRYVSDQTPGIRRTIRGRGFSYSAGGTTVDAATRRRIEELAIPPAWTDVWICPDPKGHLQATGRDARGRKQYRYHPQWRQVRDEAKFDRLLDFGEALPNLRTTVAEDLGRSGLTFTKVVALVVSLLDRTLIRVGNEEYRRDNGTFGLTTLEADHVEISGTDVTFHYLGKHSLEHEVTLKDRQLARAVRSCHELGGRELFTYRGEDGLPVRVDSADCNEYLAEVVGTGTTVKYFRTWGATVTALEALVSRPSPLEKADVLAAVDEAALRLGNTRAVCRRAYIHPSLTENLKEEAVREAWAAARTTALMTRSERALIHLLGDHSTS